MVSFIKFRVQKQYKGNLVVQTFLSDPNSLTDQWRHTVDLGQCCAAKDLGATESFRESKGSIFKVIQNGYF